MKNLFQRKVIFAIAAVTLTAGHSARANEEVRKLLDAYVVAKSDSAQMNDEDIKKTPYTIQVASYINEKDAASHVEELRIQERDVRYFPAFIRGQVWYKVCIGRFESKDMAETYRKAFTKRVDEPFSVVISMMNRPTVAEARDVRETREVRDARAPANETRHEPAAVSEAIANSAKPQGFIYSLQVGSFPEEQMAKDHMLHLPKDQKTIVRPAVLEGKTWYRIYVGDFASRGEAEGYQKTFTAQVKGIKPLIRKIPKG